MNIVQIVRKSDGDDSGISIHLLNADNVFLEDPPVNNLTISQAAERQSHRNDS